MEPPPVITQPASWPGQGDPFTPGSGGSVTIRNLTNSPDDCFFAGRLSVEAFRSRMVHVTSERRYRVFHNICYTLIGVNTIYI